MENTRSDPFCLSAGTIADIRDYAYHLYLESGRMPDRDVGNWLEAEACLRANIPKDCSDQRLHHHLSRSRKGAKDGAN